MKNSQPDKFSSIEWIAPDTYRISEFNMLKCYLVNGTEKALLIDSGLGLGNHRTTVEELTKLPVTLVATHAHCDHVLGAG